MNQHFIQSLKKAKTADNAALIEAVTKLYVISEKKAMLEGNLENKLAAGLIGVGSALGTYGALTKAPDIRDLTIDKVHEIQSDWAKDAKTQSTTTELVNQTASGVLLHDKVGYKFVDYTKTPNLFDKSMSYKGLSLDMLDKNQNILVGWMVSPDGKEVYSTITGVSYRLPVPFDEFVQEGGTREQLKQYQLGYSPIAINPKFEEFLPYCGIDSKFHNKVNGEDGNYVCDDIKLMPEKVVSQNFGTDIKQLKQEGKRT